MIQDCSIDFLRSRFGGRKEWLDCLDFSLNIMSRYPVFLAGGAARELAWGLVPTGDYDFFPCSTDVSHIKEMSGGKESIHALNIKMGNRLVQFMNAPRGDIFTTLAGFDFTVCQFAINQRSLFFSIEALTSQHNRQLAVTKRLTHPMHCMMRVFKYLKKGFRVDSATVAAIMGAYANSGRDDEYYEQS
jgi:hypothetical protein